MIRLPICLFLILWPTLSIAQEVSGDDARLGLLAERSRIQSERDAGESRFNQQEAACYAKFAVSDCLRNVRLDRRRFFDDLSRQTMILNDMERKRRILSKMPRKELSKN